MRTQLTLENLTRLEIYTELYFPEYFPRNPKFHKLEGAFKGMVMRITNLDGDGFPKWETRYDVIIYSRDIDKSEISKPKRLEMMDSFSTCIPIFGHTFMTMYAPDIFFNDDSSKV